MNRVRVAVRAEDAVAGVGLASYLDCQAEIDVVPCTLPLEADALVFAVETVDDAAIAFMRQMAKESHAKMVLVTRRLPETEVFTAVACRVVSVLSLVEASGEDLVAAVLDAASAAELPADLLNELVEQIQRVGAGKLLSDGFDAREIDVLRLLADGLDTMEIARQLCYSERTVKNALHRLLTRMRLKNRQHAVAYALRAGVI
ncbi:LuxR C-terminal-related transcriptional regulator [Amycolatopsis sp. EV170708-02-1]|uniref:helix-turn-helix transcriptional regulator n=1 Tax=Amycolatopsis sp. EV170708-02-1 TaxID=2919322 RepID=UPI001F0BEC54|nr:LuxR C-terminal-related transcriptional regulator [Amycolatopsis sp. EV170708-02-1]UMP06985.1 LuxR C-terminal-related transcriptional regulator [Amycolatopsis sp. EV170708-02-1]